MGQARLNPSTGGSSLPVWVRWASFLLVAVLGLLIRLPQLGARPMHTDEAVNAYIVGQLLAGQSFTYDPQDRHGPALAAFALPLVRMQGVRSFADLTESEVRLAPVLAGIATILLFGTGVEMFGFAPCLIAALLFAGSPLSVYYDRYFIHESLFTAATLGLILAGGRAFMRPSIATASLAAACAALIAATKETAVLHLFALAAAALVFWKWNLHGKSLQRFRQPKLAITAAGIFLLVSLALFTWFGSNWKALPDLLHAVPGLMGRASGEGHQKPFWYYAQLLSTGWAGGIILALAAIGFIQTVRKRDPSPIGFLAFYAFFISVLYCLIPYKTPWLALNLWLPIALFDGVAMHSLWSLAVSRPAFRIPIQASCILAVSLAAALTLHDTRLRVFLQPADESNPYAYAHTSEDLPGLPAELARLAQMDGIANPRIAVIASDPWPLPWYLRHYSQAGFWQPGQQPGPQDFYITSAEAASQYGDQLQSFRAEYFGARPGVLILLWAPATK